ncbi:MAG: hypothetical protein KDG89_10680 [Geminicoccaceae bacterium]|nr:hypothetical protein [Geminicoccaceae bacterium]
MRTRHDTTMLQAAVAVANRRAAIPAVLAGAGAYRERLRAEAWRWLAGGAALAIAAIGIGAGVALARPTPARPAAGAPPSALDDVRRQLGELEGNLEPGTGRMGAKVTTNFAVFRETTISLFDREWVLNAGHHFDSSDDPTWSKAWCYSQLVRDGVVVSLDLARRTDPATAPELDITTSQTLQTVGLTTTQAKELAAYCPWLEGGPPLGPAGSSEPAGKPSFNVHWDGRGQPIPA